MVRQFFAVALILLTLAPAPADDAFPAATTTRVAMQSEADQLVLASFLKHADGAAARLTLEAVARIEQVEDICWIWSRYADMPLVAFELTGDAQYLNRFTPLSPGRSRSMSRPQPVNIEQCSCVVARILARPIHRSEVPRDHQHSNGFSLLGPSDTIPSKQFGYRRRLRG